MKDGLGLVRSEFEATSEVGSLDNFVVVRTNVPFVRLEHIVGTEI
jgi:hypothetical protein